MSKSGAGNPEKGKALFGQQCIACHAATSTEKKIGPGLKGLFKKEKLTNGKKATEQNIRAQVDNGGNGMPAYKDMLSDPERNDLIEYLRTL
jgi:mono/diheme cytochrome c family protein